MALTVTPGASTADSYVSLVDALAYHAAKGNAAWAAAASDALREAALRRATVWLDGTYRTRWPGYRVNGRVQALDWPRTDVTDSDGWTVDYLTIPAEVVNATCEAALRELAEAGSLSPDYVASEQVKTAAAGPVSVTYRDTSGPASTTPILTIVDGILGRLITTARNTVWLVRS